MTSLLLPNTDLVSVAWVKRNTKLIGASVAVTTSLPNDAAQLAKGVVELSIIGGTPHAELPVRKPIVQASCYASAPGSSSKVPWNMAFQFAEWVWEQTYDPLHMNVLVTPGPSGYAQARVMTVEAITEPRRVPGDQGNLARVDVELLLNWTGV